MDPLVELTDLQRLLDIVQRHGLESLAVREDDLEINITALPAAEVAAVLATVAPEPLGDDRPSHWIPLKSPITGVFYRSSSPNEPSFVKEGDVVEETDTVCLIEAMKIFNEISAGARGRVVRVVAANEQLVVTGETLMEFEPLDGHS
ncbi:MAG: hypothetical protein IT204_17310 [Fimbriimonadaceae bacterium]|nr:hypothetical protein [Fimbriimonadaceae bacterium]